jgi:hypothetical protein
MSNLYSVTEENLEKSMETLTVASNETFSIKRGRGRPRKNPLSEQSIIENEEKEQEHKKVPVFVFEPAVEDNFGKWKKIKVTEQSPPFIYWLNECQKMVDEHFGENKRKLVCKTQRSWIFVQLSGEGGVRPFAFIDKNTGNIHNPCLPDEPFDHFAGNIDDEETGLYCMGPYGVDTPWEFLPTHPDYKRHHR